jgi:hypothetical protein
LLAFLASWLVGWLAGWLITSALKMDTASFSEMLTFTNQSTRRLNPEEQPQVIFDTLYSYVMEHLAALLPHLRSSDVYLKLHTAVSGQLETEVGSVLEQHPGTEN